MPSELRSSAQRRLSVGALVACALPAAAQDEELPAGSLTEQLGEAVRAGLADPAWLDRFGEAPRPGRFLRLFEGLRLTPELFERDSGGELALGFSWAVEKRLIEYDEAVPRSFDLVARGHVALQQSSNPDDFQSAQLRLRWWGTRSLDSAVPTRAERAESLPNPPVEELAEIDSRRFTELAARAAQPGLERDPDFRALAGEYRSRVQRELAPEVAWDFDLHFGLETTQDLSDHQWVAGTSVGGRLLAWDPEARLARYNPFALPAAALSWLAGQEKPCEAGLAYPALVLGLDVVDASRDGSRRATTDVDSFLRSRVELGYAAPVLELAGEPLVLSAAWRWFQELDPPDEVRDADDDDASQLELGLRFLGAWQLRYRSGRPPLDTRDDSTFALGYELGL